MTILDTILDTKREEVARLRAASGAVFPARTARVRPFLCAAGLPVQLIAEIKRASPSAGVIREDFDPARIARSYADAGAHAISILTDRKYFQGSLEHMQAAREAAGLAVLRKDFLIDEIQVDESVSAGADAVLLIARALPGTRLGEMVSCVCRAGLAALVEVHDAQELDHALHAGASIIGVNNRDLATFTVDLAVTLDLAPRVPDDRLLVSESGIRTRDDVARLADAGVGAILVGETLMRAENVAEKVSELLGDSSA